MLAAVFAVHVLCGSDRKIPNRVPSNPSTFAAVALEAAAPVENPADQYAPALPGLTRPNFRFTHTHTRTLWSPPRHAASAHRKVVSPQKYARSRSTSTASDYTNTNTHKHTHTATRTHPHTHTQTHKHTLAFTRTHSPLHTRSQLHA